MAVYKRRYNSYTGSLTAGWVASFFVLTKYAFADLFKSRFFVILLVFCIVPCLFFAGYIFVANNKTLQLLMQLRTADFFQSGEPIFRLHDALADAGSLSVELLGWSLS